MTVSAPKWPSTDEVREAARGRWLAILPALAPSLRKAVERAPRHVPCPIHGGHDGFRLFEDAAESGGGICNTCGTWGDGFSLLMWANGWDFKRAKFEVAQFMGMMPGAAPRAPRPSPRPVTPAPGKQNIKAQQIIGEIIAGCRPDNGRLALYLKHRGLSGRVPEVLRLHPALTYFDGDEPRGRYPAMVAPVQAANGRTVALHRTYLDHAGHGKADVSEPKKLTPAIEEGATRGAAIRLAEPDGRLALAEGIETAIAVMEATGLPAWATVSAGGLEAVEVPESVRTIYIWGDFDTSGRGQEAATTAAARFKAEGRDVYLLLPDRADTDWLDVLNERGAEALQKALAEAQPWTPELEAADEPEEAPAGVGVLDVPPFPVEVFPKQVARFVEEAAAAIGCPVDFVGVGVLATLSAAIGNSRRVELKKGWTEGACLYLAIVADPGSGKTPALMLATKPLREIQQRLADAYAVAMQEYEEERAQAKDRQAAANLREPVMAQTFTTNTTVEALAELLHQNPRGLAVLPDELSAWVRGLNQYKAGKGADREFFLSLWSGQEIIVNRKGKSALYVADPHITLCGAIPPDILPDLTDEHQREDGLTHRLLFCYPEHMSERWTEAEVSEITARGYTHVVNQLRELEGTAGPNNRRVPAIVPLTPEGKATWVAWYDSHMAEMDSPVFPDALRGPWAKMRGYCARLALILHLTRKVADRSNTPDSVDEISVAAAADLADYFKAHARKVWAHLRASPEDKRMLKVLAWVRANGGATTARDLQRRKVAGIDTTAAAQEILKKLEKRGYGRTETTPARHGQRVTFSLHARDFRLST